MKTKLITLAVSVACATFMLPIANPAFAQPTATQGATATNKAQAKAEREEFYKTHEWVADHWELKGGEPKSSKTRAEINAERDAFLKVNRWDPQLDAWVPIKAQPRDISKLPRDQVKKEAAEFSRTYEWDEPSGKYIPRRVPLRAK